MFNSDLFLLDISATEQFILSGLICIIFFITTPALHSNKMHLMLYLLTWSNRPWEKTHHGKRLMLCVASVNEIS